MNLLHAIILGIVEGITEFLPISSTGHLILTARLLKISQTDFMKTFEIAIQLGAILSVLALYWRSLIVDFKFLKRIITAFIPTAIIGFIFYKLVKEFLLDNDKVVLWALFLGGIFLIIFELLHREKDETNKGPSEISYRQAFIIGLFQSIAIIPGISRAAATIYGGLILGLNRKTIVGFSFLLAVPTMLTATGLDLVKSAGAFSSQQAIFLVAGFLTSFIVALFSIKFLLNYIKRHNFILFGIYRIIIALIFWLVR